MSADGGFPRSDTEKPGLFTPIPCGAGMDDACDVFGISIQTSTRLN